MNLLSSYQSLIRSPQQLALCAQATSVKALLQQLKHLWSKETLTDDQLMGELMVCNRQLHNIDIAALNGLWLPYRYHAKTRSISWCLPQGNAIEPFHDQYVERCRRTLLNQIITPKTSLEPLLRDQVITNLIPPAGFIFHLSRCGSTLVSGCLAELNNTCVLSESPLLTECMLDDSLDENAKQRLLPQLIHLQGSTAPERYNIIIKWNAWDIFYWPLIRALYPQVPVLFLVRNPIEILASHQHSAGRHMAGDKTLMVIEQIRNAQKAESLFGFREKLLQLLLREMKKYSDHCDVMIMDYAHLAPGNMLDIVEHFNLGVDSGTRTSINVRMNFHSKFPDQIFLADSQNKLAFFRLQNLPEPSHELKWLYHGLAHPESSAFVDLG